MHPWMNDYLVSNACLLGPKIPKVVFFFQFQQLVLRESGPEVTHFRTR